MRSVTRGTLYKNVLIGETSNPRDETPDHSHIVLGLDNGFEGLRIA